MKIAVIGAGIVGITTAYELAQRGNEVSVFERNAAVAEGASFANSGILAPSLAHPMALPPLSGATGWGKLKDRSGIKLRKGWRWGDYRWRMQWQSCPSEEVFRATAAQVHQLVSSSQENLQRMLPRLLTPVEQSAGQMVVFRTEAQVLAWKHKLDLLSYLGVSHQVLLPQTVRKLETGLGAGLSFHSALNLENDGVINCRQLAHILKEEAQLAGVNFRFDTRIQSIQAGPSLQFASPEESGTKVFDALVICNGHEAGQLLQALGCKTPLTALHSYSVSGHIREPLNAPQSAVLDAQTGISMVRIGGRVRVAGGWELGAQQQPHDEKTLNTLYDTLQLYFPGATHFQGGSQVWRGTASFTPDGLPLVGQSQVKGVWINAGHGVNGVGMASACAMHLAEMIANKAPSPDIQALNPLRFVSQ